MGIFTLILNHYKNYFRSFEKAQKAFDYLNRKIIINKTYQPENFQKISARDSINRGGQRKN